ncbi:MAG: transketolase [Coriobacteriia bacterium]|nr:transketolase [Coriobacteriia bacterium]
MSRIPNGLKVEDFSEKKIKDHASSVRRKIITMLNKAKSGHPGGSLSAADMLSTLYFGGALTYDPTDPLHPARDRFILSKGHAAPVLYAVLNEIGFIPDEALLTLRKVGSSLQGHPDMRKCAGIEVSTGSLGQGLSIACGMAFGLALDKDYPDDARQIFVMTGDGELQEGQNWEAIMLAGCRKIPNLVAIVDHNGLQIDGFVEDVLSLGDLQQKFEAFGWKTLSIDGHDIMQIQEALLEAKAYAEGPVAIIAKTIKGKGVTFMENQVGWHGKAPNDEETLHALEELK